MNTINDLEQAIRRARLFLEPATGFTWGTKIYEPKDDDPEAPLKREIIAVADKVMRHFGSGIRDGSITHFPREIEAYLCRVETELTGPEQSGYRKFFGAIQEIIEIGNTCATQRG